MTSSSSQASHQLQLHALSIDDSYNTMTVSFDTYKHKKDPHPFRLRLYNDHTAVPVVTFMCQYLKLRGFAPGPLFILKNGKSVSRKHFSEFLDRNLKICCSGQLINIRPHSFRIGAATRAIELGFNEEQVRLMGRWHSQAFRSYVRSPVLSFKA